MNIDVFVRYGFEGDLSVEVMVFLTPTVKEVLNELLPGLTLMFYSVTSMVSAYFYTKLKDWDSNDWGYRITVYYTVGTFVYMSAMYIFIRMPFEPANRIEMLEQLLIPLFRNIGLDNEGLTLIFEVIVVVEINTLSLFLLLDALFFKFTWR